MFTTYSKTLSAKMQSHYLKLEITASIYESWRTQITDPHLRIKTFNILFMELKAWGAALLHPVLGGIADSAVLILCCHYHSLLSSFPQSSLFPNIDWEVAWREKRLCFFRREYFESGRECLSLLSERNRILRQSLIKIG